MLIASVTKFISDRLRIIEKRHFLSNLTVRDIDQIYQVYGLKVHSFTYNLGLGLDTCIYVLAAELYETETHLSFIDREGQTLKIFNQLKLEKKKITDFVTYGQ